MINTRTWIYSAVVLSGHLSAEVKVHNKPELKFHVENKVVTGKSPFPCTPVAPLDNPWPNTQVEPSIAIGRNPIDHRYPMIVIGYQEDRYSAGGGANADYMIISLDGGKTFGKPIPVPNVTCFGGPYDRASDPNVAISSTGDIYYATLPFSLTTGLWNVSIAKYNVRKKKFSYVKYLDSENVHLPPFFAVTDFDGIIADPQDESGKTVYVTWDYDFYPNANFSKGQSILKMSKTTDGVNWSPPMSIYQFPESVVANYGGDAGSQFGGLALLNNPGKPYSKLLNTFQLAINQDIPPLPFVQASFFYSTVSCDQGKTWSNPIPLDNTLNNVFGQVVDPDNFDKIIRAFGGGAVVDRDRNIIYNITQEHSLVYDGIPSQVILYVSTDDAASWNKIGPINTVLSTQAFSANASIIDEGRIAVSYYDFRKFKGNDPSGSLKTDRWLDIYYYDKESKKLTLETELRLTDESFNFRNAPSVQAGLVVPPGLFLGDYVSQVFFERKIYNVFGIVPQNSGPNSAHLQLSTITQIHPIPGNQ